MNIPSAKWNTCFLGWTRRCTVPQGILLDNHNFYDTPCHFKYLRTCLVCAHNTNVCSLISFNLYSYLLFFTRLGFKKSHPRDPVGQSKSFSYKAHFLQACSNFLSLQIATFTVHQKWQIVMYRDNCHPCNSHDPCAMILAWSVIKNIKFKKKYRTSIQAHRIGLTEFIQCPTYR